MWWGKSTDFWCYCEIEVARSLDFDALLVKCRTFVSEMWFSKSIHLCESNNQKFNWLKPSCVGARCLYLKCHSLKKLGKPYLPFFFLPIYDDWRVLRPLWLLLKVIFHTLQYFLISRRLISTVFRLLFSQRLVFFLLLILCWDLTDFCEQRFS